VVAGRGGMISVGHDAGAVFTAVLPACVGVDGPGPAEAPRETEAPREAKGAPVTS
jgi:hypothetical protein